MALLLRLTGVSIRALRGHIFEEGLLHSSLLSRKFTGHDFPKPSTSMGQDLNISEQVNTSNTNNGR